MKEKGHIYSVREHPEKREAAIAYFQKHWASEESMAVYEDAITRSLTAAGPLPQWYLLEIDGEIVGGVGLITNDFISAGDLYPWLCALYVEPAWRRQGLGGQLIERVARDTKEMGFPAIYLCTDLEGYYQQYDFQYLAKGYHPWGESIDIYQRLLGEGDPLKALLCEKE